MAPYALLALLIVLLPTFPTTAAPSTAPAPLQVAIGQLIQVHALQYHTLYAAKPYPQASLYYYDNGLYHITSEGEDHYGVYVLQGRFSDPVYTVSFISLPSPDWGNKTAFHQLTFVHGRNENHFIQNALIDTGEALAQQHGTFQVRPLP